ncbi:MAG: hypothetical protein MK137_07920 [Rickettsiales bacterium]|nr:hypothetical protein [Rickettsiales bacterium]
MPHPNKQFNVNRNPYTTNQDSSKTDTSFQSRNGSQETKEAFVPKHILLNNVGTPQSSHLSTTRSKRITGPCPQAHSLTDRDQLIRERFEQRAKKRPSKRSAVKKEINDLYDHHLGTKAKRLKHAERLKERAEYFSLDEVWKGPGF